jgi:hypothetical protein
MRSASDTLFPAALVRAAKRRRRRPGGRDQFRYRQTRGQDLGFQRRDVLILDQRMIRHRDRVLPDQCLLRHERAEIAVNGAHVAVGQLEPGAGEGIRELVGVLVEAPRDRFVSGVEAQRQIGGQHRRHALFRGIARVGNRGGGTFRLPLLRAGRAPC